MQPGDSRRRVPKTVHFSTVCGAQQVTNAKKNEIPHLTDKDVYQVEVHKAMLVKSGFFQSRFCSKKIFSVCSQLSIFRLTRVKDFRRA